MKLVRLSARKKAHVGDAMVDDSDFDRVNALRWYLKSPGYAARASRDELGIQRTLFMHRFVMGFGPGDPDLDHINGNKLDNRRENLRECDDAQNQWNTGKSIRNTSGYRGVTRGWGNHWSAHIRCREVLFNLGSYASAELAAAAYEGASRVLRGGFHRV
jgi:hypothetical protein